MNVHIFKMVVLGEHLLCLSTTAEKNIVVCKMDSLSVNLSFYSLNFTHLFKGDTL